MRRCSACEKDFDDDSLRFCTECGTPLAEVPTVSDPNQGTVRMGNEYDTKPMAESLPQLEVTVQLQAGERITKKQDEWAGTTGFHRALEGFSVRIVPPISGLGLRYMGHFQDIRDTDFVHEGEFLCAPGPDAKRLEGFAIELTGPAASRFEISYCAHIQAWDNTREFRSGAFCGSRGVGLRVEAIKVGIARVITLQTQEEADRELATFDDYHPLYHRTADPRVWRIRGRKRGETSWTVIERRSSYLKDKLLYGLEPTE